MKHFSIFIFILFPLLLIGQDSPYEINWKLDGPLLGSGIGLNVGSLIWNKKANDFTVNEINALNVNDVLAFDRIATRHYSKTSKHASDALLYGSIAIPMAYLIPDRTRNDVAVLAVMGLESALITSGMTNLTKGTVLRPRPLVFNPNVPLDDKYSSENRFSFFSGHTSISAVAFFYSAKVFSDYFPESRWKPLVWTIAATIPAIVGLSRIFAGKHYPTDVIVGYIVGAGTGILIPHIHKVKSGKEAIGLRAL